MLDISRISTGKLTMMREDFDLVEMVRDVVERFSPQADAAGFPVIIEAPTPVRVHGDRFRLEQVVANLLTNGLRYGEAKPVTLRIGVVGAHARLEVQDHGRGIAPENHERIFERFERAVSASEISGLGLGLYISKQIVSMHGGTMSAESELGEGATFRVDLPLGV